MSRKVPAGDKPLLETERLVLRLLSSDEVDFLHGQGHRHRSGPSVRALRLRRGGYGAGDRRRGRAQRRLAAGDREARHEVFGEH